MICFTNFNEIFQIFGNKGYIFQISGKGNLIFFLLFNFIFSIMNIYVGNLNYSVKEEDLNELFSEFGEVVSVKLIKDRETGRAKGFAFVEMTNDDEATKAIENLDGSDLEGRNMKVNQAKPREPRTPRY